VEEELSLEEEIVEYPSVILSPTLDMNEKIEQYIRKKTYKPNVLRFWIKGHVILCMFGPILILVYLPCIFPFDFSQNYDVRMISFNCLSSNDLHNVFPSSSPLTMLFFVR